MRRKIAIFALAIAAAVPGASFARGGNFTCPGGPPGHCKTGGNSSQSQQQQQQQQQTQQQRQCILVVAVLQPASC